MRPRALTIAGTDPTAGAGIARDLVTFAAFDVAAVFAVTAVTVQGPRGVHGWHEVPADVLRAQIEAAREEGLAAIKTGMVPSAAAVETIVAALQDLDVPIIVDPVLAAGSGGALADTNARDAIKAELVPRALVVTPNAPEAEALTGVPVVDEETASEAALALIAHGARNVLVTGGHLDGVDVVDVFEGVDGGRRWRSKRIQGVDTHGTGCALSAAICAGLARGEDLEASIDHAIGYVGEWLGAGGWRAR